MIKYTNVYVPTFSTIFYFCNISTILHVAFWYHSRRRISSTLATAGCDRFCDKNNYLHYSGRSQPALRCWGIAKRNVPDLSRPLRIKKYPFLRQPYFLRLKGVYIATTVVMPVLILQKYRNGFFTGTKVLWLRSPINIATRLQG